MLDINHIVESIIGLTVASLLVKLLDKLIDKVCDYGMERERTLERATLESDSDRDVSHFISNHCNPNHLYFTSIPSKVIARSLAGASSTFVSYELGDDIIVWLLC